MKLKYKITVLIIFSSLFILSSVSLIYSLWSYNNVMQNEQKKLVERVVDSAYHSELELSEKLAVTQTVASAPVVLETLLQSNDHYAALSEVQQKEEIKELNRKWKEADDANHPFIAPYLNNPLARHLKQQQEILPGTYGEIFITNRYGAMIASTGKLSTLAHAHKYWWKESYNKGRGKVFFDDRGFDESVQGYVIGVVIPIKKDGEIIGILKSNINIMGTLSSVVERYSKLDHGSLQIVRTKGVIVLEHGAPPLSTHINPQLLTNLEGMETGARIVQDDGKTKVMAYAPVRLTLEMPGIAFGGKPQTGDHIKGNEGEMWHTVIGYDKEQAMAGNRATNQMIIYIGLLFTFLSALLALLIGRWLSRPISELSVMANRIGQGELDLRANITARDEIGTLARSFNEMLDELKKTTASRDELRAEIEKRKEAEAELKEKDKLLLAQSRQAAMGEILGMLGHQWSQPLSVISMGVNNILADIEMESMTSESVRKQSYVILKQTRHLSQIIDDFKDFFTPEQKREAMPMYTVIKEIDNIVGPTLVDHAIDLEVKNESDAIVPVYKREMIQVLLNLINNAKEALIAHTEENRRITIHITEENNRVVCSICDNGGGIDEAHMHNIFDPYFTTKGVSSGVGLGLYISKTIVEQHCQGTLDVHNADKGACFTIKLPVDEEKRDV